MDNIVTSLSCINCENEFQGKFCNNCGEKAVNEKEKTVIYFLSHVIKAFTITDTKIFRTFKFLFFYPGKLSKEHLAGRRIKYTSPLQLFLFANLMYFIFQPIDILNTPLSNQSLQLYNGVVSSMVDNKVLDLGTTAENLEYKYNAISENVSKLLLIVPVLIFGLVLMLLYSKKKMLFYDHLIFSLHFFSFKIFGFFILVPFIIKYGYKALINLNIDPQNLDFLGTEEFLLLFIMPSLFLYLLLSAKNYYSQSWLLTSIKCVLLCILALYIIVFYKFFTFLVTMLLI